jgi:hypothetical protein
MDINVYHDTIGSWIESCTDIRQLIICRQAVEKLITLSPYWTDRQKVEEITAALYDKISEKRKALALAKAGVLV